MQFEREVKEMGGSLILTIPVDICRYLELTAGTKITLQDETGKKGKFISFWKKEVQVP